MLKFESFFTVPGSQQNLLECESDLSISTLSPVFNELINSSILVISSSEGAEASNG